MTEKNNKRPEYCGVCLKSFSYKDWADPVAALIRHQLEDCKRAARA